MPNSKIQHRRDEVRSDFYRRICKSWTWGRLSEEEQIKCADSLLRVPLEGTEDTMVEILHTVYAAFLDGTGYKPIGWREPAGEDHPKF